MNAADKDQRVEREAIHALEAEGYVVHRCIRALGYRNGVYIRQPNDFFG